MGNVTGHFFPIPDITLHSSKSSTLLLFPIFKSFPAYSCLRPYLMAVESRRIFQVYQSFSKIFSTFLYFENLVEYIKYLRVSNEVILPFLVWKSRRIYKVFSEIYTAFSENRKNLFSDLRCW